MVTALTAIVGRPLFLHDTTLHSQNSAHTTQHGITLYGHNSTLHNSIGPQLDTAQLNTPQLDTTQLYTDHMAVRLKLL